MHPEILKTVEGLKSQWMFATNRVLSDIRGKIAERAPQYDQVTPVWMRLTKPEQFVTMIMIKAERVRSELSDPNKTFETWDPDNAIDLIVYTLFLVAYKYFTSADPGGRVGANEPPKET